MSRSPEPHQTPPPSPAAADAAPPDLVAAARRELVAEGFEPDFPAAALAQVAAAAHATPHASDGVSDWRDLPWSSIDNVESRDLDQVELAERLDGDRIRLLVGIADVDEYVSAATPIDEHARRNATSVYTGVRVFPMLPEALSTDATSLVDRGERLAVVVELEVQRDGAVSRFDVHRALVRNGAKLAYEEVGGWLDGTPSRTIEANPVIADQLRLQDEAAQRLRGRRERCGALELETIEARPVTRDGRVVDLALVRKGRGRDLIEDFMIAANVAIAQFLERHGRSGIRRVVRRPERWERIVTLAAQYGAALPPEPDSTALARFLAARRAASPDTFVDLSTAVVKLLGPGEYALDMPGKDPGGHFGLAAEDYTHATAPNRRYADLVTQRLVKAVLAGREAPYSNDALAATAAHCTEREDAARKVERAMRKRAAAYLLGDRIGRTFDAIVTGVNKRGTFARLVSPPAEGRVVRGEQGMDVGDRVRLRLTRVDRELGHLDFEGV